MSPHSLLNDAEHNHAGYLGIEARTRHCRSRNGPDDPFKERLVCT